MFCLTFLTIISEKKETKAKTHLIQRAAASFTIDNNVYGIYLNFKSSFFYK